MPELPDVEIARRTIEAYAEQKSIEEVHTSRNRVLKTSAQKLSGMTGHRILSVSRRGKYCFVEVESYDWLVLHFGMTGSVVLIPRDADTPDYRVLSLTVKDSGKSLHVISKRKLGRIDITGSPGRYLQQHNIGKDILECSKTDFVQRMGKKKGAVKPALMDQSTVSGIGNIYADEILYQAGIHPGIKVPELNEPLLKKLYDTSCGILEKAIQAGADPEKMPESFLIRHRKEGEACPSCNGKIRKIRVSGRAGYYCPACQKK